MPDPAPEQAPLQLCLALIRVAAKLTRSMDAGLGGVHGLSLTDFSVLYHLQLAPGGRLRRSALAEALGLTASGVTRLLLPLEKRGLVAREVDARDARIGYAVLSAAGQERLNEAAPTALTLGADVLDALNPSELALVATALAGLD